MRRFVLFLILSVLLISPLHAGEGVEVIVGFDDQSDLPVLNNELRKLDETNQDIADRVTDLEGSPFVPTASNALAGSVIQIVNTQTGAVATGITNFVYTDSAPSIAGATAGTEFMTLAITPTSATNKLLIQVVFMGGCSSGTASLGIFQDSTDTALTAGPIYVSAASTPIMVCLNYFMAAGTTSATTFKVRAGDTGGGTVTFNGIAGARIYGDIPKSSITITEIKV